MTPGGTWQFDALVGGYTAGSLPVASTDVPPTLGPITATWQSDDQQAEVPARTPGDSYMRRPVGRTAGFRAPRSVSS